MANYTRMRLETGAVLASDETIRMDGIELAPDESTGPRRHPDSDLAVLFYDGRGEIRSADRTQAFVGPRHAFVPAGTIFEIRDTGNSALKMVYALCPDGPVEQVGEHAAMASPGGATLLGISQFDRFPDSGLVRGGMFFLEPGEESQYHSHDGAPEVFVFLQGTCDCTTENETVRVGSGEVVYVAPEMKHRLANVGTDRLVVWLTVTPNVTPSHTFYDQQPDGTWLRKTPRLDGRPVLPPTP